MLELKGEDCGILKATLDFEILILQIEVVSEEMLFNSPIIQFKFSQFPQFLCPFHLLTLFAGVDGEDWRSEVILGSLPVAHGDDPDGKFAHWRSEL